MDARVECRSPHVSRFRLLPGTAGELPWWAFGGIGANASLSRALASLKHSRTDNDSVAVTFESPTNAMAVEQAITELRQCDAAEFKPAVDDEAAQGLKFSECLPRELAVEMLEGRMADPLALRGVLDRHVRIVAGM